MERQEALRMLGLDVDVPLAQVESALLERTTVLEERVEGAPTESLKEKYRRQLADLEAARAALLRPPPAVPGLSNTMVGDLPLALASYTRGTEGLPPGGGGTSLQPGSVLAERYQVQVQIGSGGMGAVFSAFDRLRDKEIAIKVLLPHLVSSPKARERFLREARLASEMSHPNIATVFDVQRDGAHCFLTMEMLRGSSLRERLAALRNERRTMPVDEALRIAVQVCDALAYAHEKTVHRDIKPENIWLTDDGRAKVMDFGIALVLDGGTAAQTRMDIGTPYYMAPEQLGGDGEIDARADQYAVAAMLYEMLAGRVPVGRIESLRKLRADVPARVSRAVDKALSQSAADRFATMGAFKAALSGVGAIGGGWPFGRIALALGGVVLVVAAVATFPLWRALIPDAAAQREAKVEGARLQGEAKALMKALETQRREIKEAFVAAQRELTQLDGQLRSAKTAEERQRLELARWAAGERLEGAGRVQERAERAYEGADGIVAIEGAINAADASLRSGTAPAAIRQYQALLGVLGRLRSVPQQVRTELDAARAAMLARLDGQWGMGNCDAPSTWTAKGDVLQVYWPALGMAQEQVVQVLGDAVTTVVTTPAAQRGRTYRYVPRDTALDVDELATGRRASLVRCASR